MLLEIARLSLAVGEIPQGGAALFDGLGQHLLYHPHQPFVAQPSDTPGGGLRVNTGHEQRFTGIDVAHPHHHFVVHDEGLDADTATTRGGEQIIRIEGIGQGLRPQSLQQLVSLCRASGPQYGTKSPRITQAQAAAIGEDDIDVIVLARRRAGRHHMQTAGHAEVQDHRADSRL